MLDTMRASAGGFAAKILLAFLVLSFAIWGVGDMVRHPGRNIAVAKVGGHKISVETFQNELQKQSEKLKNALGGKFSPEMLKSIGLPQQVLQGLVNDELLRRCRANDPHRSRLPG
jgi:peptidyl-prolyl cis-trans isomerase D